MKFLCLDCDEQMLLDERHVPGDGTFAVAYECPSCRRKMAMLANPMETQLVGSLGVKIGGRTLDEQPMEQLRTTMIGRDDAFVEAPDSTPPRRLRWTPESQERLARVPNFVRGMVKRIYTEWALENGVHEITPEVMDQARTELGLEHM